VAARLGVFQCRYQPGEFSFGDREHDMILGPELVVDSSFRDPDSIGDHLQRGTADAVASKQIQCGIEHARPGSAVLDDTQRHIGQRLP
jgi:hypothetical protein